MAMATEQLEVKNQLKTLQSDISDLRGYL